MADTRCRPSDSAADTRKTSSHKLSLFRQQDGLDRTYLFNSAFNVTHFHLLSDLIQLADVDSCNDLPGDLAAAQAQGQRSGLS